MPKISKCTKLVLVNFFRIWKINSLYMNLLGHITKTKMNQSDINYIVELLNKAVKRTDWDSVTEALEYVQDFQDEPQYEEE